MLTNDQDGIAASDKEHGMATTFRKKGLDIVDLGLYPPLSDDFTSQIGQLKSNNCETICGIFNPPQFAIFWTQCAQQATGRRSRPRQRRSLPHRRRGIGRPRRRHVNRGLVVTSPSVQIGPDRPNGPRFCDAYEKATGKQWTQPLGFKHANIEVAVDVLKRTKKLDALSIRDAIKETDYQSLVGPLTWKGGPTNPVPNVCTTPLVGGQWKKGSKFKYDLNVVYNNTAPNIPLDSPFEPIKYS